MDTVGTAGDGLGLLRFRLYVPEHIQEGEDYPLVATLGGLGSTNSFANNGYALQRLRLCLRRISGRAPLL